MFYFAENDKNDLEVMDGQQRLTSIFGFLDPRSIDKETRKKLFKKITIEDNNLTVSNNDIKHKILNSEIYCVQALRMNLNAKYEIFRILNQGATSLKPQEIEKKELSH